MPVRSSNSSVLKWPDHKLVRQALETWVRETVAKSLHVIRVGYFGSYARGDWGVGSDLDLIVIVEESGQPFERRPLQWDTSELPVPTDVIVYTAAEWNSPNVRNGLRRSLEQEVVWVYER